MPVRGAMLHGVAFKGPFGPESWVAPLPSLPNTQPSSWAITKVVPHEPSYHCCHGSSPGSAPLLSLSLFLLRRFHPPKKIHFSLFHVYLNLSLQLLLSISFFLPVCKNNKSSLFLIPTLPLGPWSLFILLRDLP